MTDIVERLRQNPSSAERLIGIRLGSDARSEEETTMDETDILPCPFCGQQPKVEMTGFRLGGRTIRCETDDCMSPHTTAACIDDAVIQWNRRPTSRHITVVWKELVEKDDRSSPEEYPDMALITRDELADFLSR